MRRLQRCLQFVLAVLLVLMCGARLGAAEKQRPLCPNLVASLMPVPGNLDAMLAAERVEVRQCPIDLKRKSGTVQLVGWSDNALHPDLVFETEDSGFYQVVMIPGVYVFELMGGQSSRVVAIVFENGMPSLALNEGSYVAPRISSDSSKVVVEVEDRNRKKDRYEFKGTMKARRY